MHLSSRTSTVPGEPRKIKVEALNSTAISVQWRPADDRDLGVSGIIRGYQIYYGPDVGTSSNGGGQAENDYAGGMLSGSMEVFDVADPAKTEAVVSGLVPDTTYVVQLAAYTRKGDGRRSRPYRTRTKGAGKGYAFMCADVVGSRFRRDRFTL